MTQGQDMPGTKKRDNEAILKKKKTRNYENFYTHFTAVHINHFS
jgi:hypothetical protein